MSARSADVPRISRLYGRCAVGERGGVRVQPAHLTTQLLDHQMTLRRRPLGGLRHHRIDGVVVQCRQEARLPVMEEPGWVGLVQHALEGRVGHRPDPVDQGTAEGAQGPQQPLALGGGPVIARRDDGDRLAIGRAAQDGEAGELRRCGCGEGEVEAKQVAGGCIRVDQETADDLPDRVQAILERGRHAEVPAPAPDCPEQVGFLGRARGPPLAVGGHHVHRHQIVGGEPIGAGEPADAAAERQPADPGGGHDASRGGETEGVGLPIELTPGGTSLDPYGAARRIHPDRSHAGQVDHHSPVAHGVAGDVVTAAAHGQPQPVFPGEVHGADHVHDPGAAGDHRRMAVDAAVPDPASLLVAGVTGEEQGTAEVGAELPDLGASSAGTTRDSFGADVPGWVVMAHLLLGWIARGGEGSVGCRRGRPYHSARDRAAPPRAQRHGSPVLRSHPLLGT